MADKDITMKVLADFNDVFADILNVLVYGGKQVIRPEDLTDARVRSMYKMDGRPHEQERDLAKILLKNHTRIDLIGIENQTEIDRGMALRVMGYDGAAYRAQYFNDLDEVYKVVTIVLYYGQRHWKGTHSLKDLVTWNENDPLDQLCWNHGYALYEIAWLTEEQVKLFKSDFRFVAQYYVHSRMHKDYVPLPGTIRHVDALLKLMAAVTRDHRYEDVIREIPQERKENGEVTMTQLLDSYINRRTREIIEEGIENGIEEGILQGRKEGAADNATATAMRMIKAGKYSDEEILSITGITPEQLAEIRSSSDRK